jgi:acyl dehydratase
LTGHPSATGYDIRFGTYEEARALVGTTTERRWAATEVNVAMIRQFAALVRDPNPSYWDEEFALGQWGAVVAPPAMLMTWFMPLEWEPGGAVPVPLLTARVPLPGTTFVNVANEAELFEPVRVGDRLSVEEELTNVSPEKRTSLGSGHFVTTVSTYRRQDEVVVARTPNVLFRYDPDTGLAGEPGLAAEPGHKAGDKVSDDAGELVAPAAQRSGEEVAPGVQRYWEEVTVGEALPHVEDPITYRRVVMTPGATLDYFPGHHDPEYARAQGQPTIYLNTLHFLGFVDRLATAWGGPASFVAFHRVSVRRSIYAGDTMVGDGRVVARSRGPAPAHRLLVELAITVTNQRGELCAPATVLLQLPGAAGRG